MTHPQSITPEMLIRAYSLGIFPMARHRHGAIDWFQPDPRAILPLHPPEAFTPSRSLMRRYRSGRFTLTRDRDFASVIRHCAQPRRQQPDTWINDQIIDAYTRLHQLGLAHSVEAWRDDQLVGGLYGVSLGGAFFGESMFSIATDASKVCLIHLVHHLRTRGYRLLDVQLQSPHMARFGVIEIPHRTYERLLNQALAVPVTWGEDTAVESTP